MGARIPDAAELLLNETNTLISLPEICLKLRELLKTPEHSLDDVCKLIVHDPSLTTRVLKIVNSAYYGLSSKVQSISHALNVLGEVELNNLIYVTAIFNTMNNIQTRLDMKRFWQSSVYCAVLSQNIEARVQMEDGKADEIFITGLLLNVGKLLLYYSEPKLLDHVQKEMKERDVADFVVEQEVLGFDHAHVGSLMAKKWHFSDRMVQSIQAHHKYNEDLGPEKPVLFAAALISDSTDFKKIEGDAEDEIDFQKYGLPGSLGLELDEFHGLLEKSYEDYLQAYETFCGN